MALVIPDPRWETSELLYPGRKPVGNVVIDWSHPLTKGLVRYYLPSSATITSRSGDGQLWDYAKDKYSQYITANTSTMPLQVATPIGLATSSPTASYAAKVDNIKEVTTDGTLACLFTPVITQGSNSIVFAHVDFGAGHRFYMGMNSMSVYIIRLGNGVTEFPAFGDAGDLVVDTPVMLSQSFSSVLADTFSYKDGIHFHTFTRDSNDPFSDASASMFGYGTSSKFSARGTHHVAALWDRQLSHSENASFAANPYQFLIPA